MINMRFLQIELTPQAGQTQRLANELMQLDNAIVLAKKRRNMLSPAYRLPAEVLSMIFLATRDLYYTRIPVDKNNDASVLSLGFIVISHVCGDWRSVSHHVFSSFSAWVNLTLGGCLYASPLDAHPLAGLWSALVFCVRDV